jgi:dipeptidyl aminopeptidase/acylaminoacyl peptidase
MTLRQIHELQMVGEVATSPDGRHIAYTRIVPRELFEEEDGPAWSELHIVDAQGQSRGFVTGGECREAWLDADSRSVTFLSKRGDDKTRRLYVIDVAGGEARTLFSFDTDLKDYSLAPDGKRLAFVAADKDSEELEAARKHGFTQRVFEEEARPFLLRIVTPGSTSDTVHLPLEAPRRRWHGVPLAIGWPSRSVRANWWTTC